MKKTKNAYITPKLIIHGTVEELTMAKIPAAGDAWGQPPGKAKGKVIVDPEDAFLGRSQS